MSSNIFKLYDQRSKLRAKLSRARNDDNDELVEKFNEELEKLGRQIDRLKKER